MDDISPDQRWIPWDPSTSLVAWVKAQNDDGWFQSLDNTSRAGTGTAIEFLCYRATPGDEHA